MANGTPVRLLSASSRLRGGHGNYHEGDQPKPKEFLEAAAFLTEAQRPSVIRLTEEVKMTLADHVIHLFSGHDP